jgi:hypothetical protein
VVSNGKLEVGYNDKGEILGQCYLQSNKVGILDDEEIFVSELGAPRAHPGRAITYPDHVMYLPRFDCTLFILSGKAVALFGGS